MPVVEEFDLNVFAVLWEAAGIDNYANPILTFPPIQIDCRWNTGSRSTKPQSGTEDLRMIVNREIKKGSVLWIGKLVNLPDPNVNPDFNQTEIYTVVDKSNTPDLRGVETFKVLILQRSKAKIPTN